MNKMSRTDIYLYAYSNGLSHAAAVDLSYELSPECETVAYSKVARRVAAILSDPSGKV